MPDGHAPPAGPDFRFDNSFARDLPGFFVDWPPAPVPRPRLVRLNEALAVELGLDPDALRGETGAAVFAGNAVPKGAHPLAQAYAGHQFGGFSPQLGDGRAVLLGEVIDRDGQRRDIALKGSGQTPFSRRGDGKAALGPVLREYLIGEGMHALGIPTTRALAAATTGETVQRETALPGAVLTRVAASHIRVGTFQFFAARGDMAAVQRLTDYVIARHYPDLPTVETPALALLAEVSRRQARLIARWMGVGFIHGVMNTDNMTLSGETIDYGPCAFLDSYAAGTVFSSIDQTGRYAYGNQPAIGQWNLARLAETLLEQIDPVPEVAVERASEALGVYATEYKAAWLAGMRGKLGLGLVRAEDDDAALATALLAIMEAQQADFTLTFRRLSRAALGDEGPVRAQFGDAAGIDGWLAQWHARIARDGGDAAARAEAMDRVNPAVIPRNHKVEEALTEAVEHDDFGPFETLLQAITSPFEEVPGREAFALPPPASFGAGYRTFCGT